MSEDKDYIGTHIVMDVITNNRELFRDEGLAIKYLNKMIEVADMTCLRYPEAFNFPYSNEYTKLLEELEEDKVHSSRLDERLKIHQYNKNQGSGVTGFAILCESHVALHSFPEKDEPFMSICLYSCKRYDERKIIDLTKDFWDLKSINVVLMDRFVSEPQKIRQWSE